MTYVEIKLKAKAIGVENQLGFRQKRSSMTALTSMQKEWVQNTEDGLKTGILIWDLGAAYNTIDNDLLCDKLL